MGLFDQQEIQIEYTVHFKKRSLRPNFVKEWYLQVYFSTYRSLH